MRRTSSATLEFPEDTLVMLCFQVLFTRKPPPARVEIKSYVMFSSLVLLICRTMNTCKRINVMAFILGAVILQVGARQHNHSKHLFQ